MLFWIWWNADSLTGSPGEELADTTLFVLAGVVSACAANSQDEALRLIAVDLLRKLIKDVSAGQEDVQLMLLKDLVLEAPREGLRAAAVSILRDVVAAKFAAEVSLPLSCDVYKLIIGAKGD